jgi:hypothetical protein
VCVVVGFCLFVGVVVVWTSVSGGWIGGYGIGWVRGAVVDDGLDDDGGDALQDVLGRRWLRNLRAAVREKIGALPD